MTVFSDALRNAGITPTDSRGYDKKKASAFTLEMKLHEMKDHILAMDRIYQKYVKAEGDDKFDYVDSLANRFGYMVIAFQDIIATIGKADGTMKKSDDISIRRAISEFQGMFEAECRRQRLDDAVTSFADRNEIVHVYENYRGNMELVLENVQSYRKEYGAIRALLWDYCEKEGILNQ